MSNLNRCFHQLCGDWTYPLSHFPFSQPRREENASYVAYSTFSFFYYYTLTHITYSSSPGQEKTQLPPEDKLQIIHPAKYAHMYRATSELGFSELQPLHTDKSFSMRCGSKIKTNFALRLRTYSQV